MIAVNNLRERFLKDPSPVRWGGIASDLARLASAANLSVGSQAFQDVLTEVKLFTEWLAPDLGLEQQETLLSLQRQLSKWSGRSSIAASSLKREAERWSDRILEISGLRGRRRSKYADS